MAGRNRWAYAIAGVVLALGLTCREDSCGPGTGPDCRIATPHAEVTMLSAGPHDCIVAASGAAYCWGANSVGQLGDGSTSDSRTPVPVAGGLRVVTVSAGGLQIGEDHTCAVTTERAGYCWGANNFGQLGSLISSGSTTPVPLTGGLRFNSISAGGGFHTCGVTTSGAAYCWGNNFFGQLGNGSGGLGSQSSVPVPVAGGLSFASVSSGGFYTCGVTTGGAAYCWGFNVDGQLGNGSMADSKAPLAVAGGVSFKMVSAGGSSRTCGIATGGTAYCWGAGLLGDGRLAGSPTPVFVAGGLSFESVSSGFDHTCGGTSNGTVYCWGGNRYGQLGDGTQTDRATPVPVSGDLSFVFVSAGFRHTCGLSTEMVAYCWGGGRGTPTHVIDLR
jgi:alpha-tubulin suppressor-like RCC1 family protein